MSAPKSKRITISGRNLQFLQQLSRDMDVESLSEVLAYLLTDVRLLNYKIGDKPASMPITQTPLGYTFDPSTFEKAAPIPECDRNELPEPLSEMDANINKMIDAGMLTMLGEF